jgi:hypothetical protein
VKKLSLLFFSLIFVLSSCAQDPAPIVKSFTSVVSSNCNGQKIKAKVTSDNHNVIYIEVSSPASMKGYSYTYKDNTLTIKYKTFKVTAETSYLPDTAFSSIIYNVLTALNKENNCYCTGSDNGWATYGGKCDSGKFKITTEYSTGVIRKIEIKSINFSGSFVKQ